MSKDDYGCSRAGCPSRFPTAEARDAHSEHEHKPCPHGCGQTFVVTGLGQHVKKCPYNPESRGKLRCSHTGCTAVFSAGEQVKLTAHEAEPHQACVCGSEFMISSLRKHQVRCSHWLTEQASERDSARKSMVCVGCDETVAEGEHYLTISVQLDSCMPASYVPVREMDPTGIENVVLHGPACLVKWAQQNGLIASVFGQWSFQSRLYLLEHTGVSEGVWVPLHELIQKLADSKAGYSSGKLAKEFDGLVRAITPEENSLMRTLLQQEVHRRVASN